MALTLRVVARHACDAAGGHGFAGVAVCRCPSASPLTLSACISSALTETHREAVVRCPT